MNFIRAFIFLIGGIFFLIGAIAVLKNASIKFIAWIYILCAVFYLIASTIDIILVLIKK